ncbi:P-loop ATPase, Sll1717 family [Methylobacterium tarhaniae]|uniref:P-loop ATPase, Sll1717 family n=1 Tax=Methylobacterium tarhaniae TaxID=1187852 RepID=UPI000AF0DAB1|nr:hypothetical protein [Methylobacterium tarhaniae]
MLSLQNLSSFGDVAAEDDAVLDYFLATNVVSEIQSSRAFLVLGRKGTGKTAIVRFLTEGNKKPNNFAKSLNLRGYPWALHAKIKDRGASEIEAYVSSWRYIIFIEIASLILSHPRITHSMHAKGIKEFLQENYGGSSPDLGDILRPRKLKLGKLSVQPSIMGNQLGSLDLERTEKDYQLGLELNALARALFASIVHVIQEAGLGLISIHFDELDQGLSTLDESRKQMLIGLVLAAREVKRECDKEGVAINPIVYLRTDLWDELQFSDKNKISQTLTLNLSWKIESLLDLVETRLRAKLSEDAKWDDIAENDLMRGSQTKWNHILARTFLRPRDVIRFLNASLTEAKRRSVDPLYFTNKDIVNSRDDYSTYLENELDDEIRHHWPQWDEALQACSAISTITFDRSDFVREYDRRKSNSNFITSEEALRILYRFSVIGYEKRSGYGGSSWSFQYIEPEVGWDNAASRFKVHLGLKEYAKLRETRQ